MIEKVLVVRRLAIAAIVVMAATMPSLATTAAEDAVLLANAAFYRAFAERDIPAMEEIWVRDAPIAVIHPGWPGLNGREAVMRSWRAILGGPAAPAIEVVGALAHLYGDTAFVICYELLADGVMIATNVFVRRDGAWKMVHHQAGPTAGPPPGSGQPT